MKRHAERRSSCIPEALERRVLFDTLVISGTAGDDVIALSVNATGNIVAVVNGTQMTYDPKQYTDVQVQGDGGHDTLNVQATVLPTTAMFVAVVNVGDPHGVQDIHAPVVAQAALDVALNADDTGDAAARHVTVDTPPGYGHEVISGLAPADISVDLLPVPAASPPDAPLANQIGPVVTVTTGSGADSVDVKGALAITGPVFHILQPGEGGVLTLDNSGGADSITIGNNGDMSTVGGTLRVRDHAGTSSLTIDDPADKTSRNVNLQVSNESTQSAEDVSGLSQAIINFAVPQVSSVRIDGGSGGNTFAVQNTNNVPETITLNTGTADDSANVDATGTGAVLNVNTQSGDDDVAVSVLSQSGIVNVDEGSHTNYNRLDLIVPAPQVVPAGIPPMIAPTATLTAGKATAGGPGVVSYQNATDLFLEGGGNFAVDGDLGPISLTVFGNPPPARDLTFDITTTVQVNASQHLRDLDIIAAAVNVAPGIPKGLDVASLLIQGGTLDLNNGVLQVHYTAADPFSSIRLYLFNHQIFSTAADEHHNLGYADSADGVVHGLADKTVLVKFTLYGDANLDGAVNFADLLLLAQNYGKTQNANWDQGDFDYNGSIGFSDLLDLAQNYGKLLPATHFTKTSS